MVFAGIVTLLLVVLWPGEAHAWGPVTHLVHGSQMLANVSILAPALQEILREHRKAYLYGCVAADIVQAKKYTRNLYTHCHCWPVGWQIAGAATTEREQAFAGGYLSHLAGDVYSHNHFVPVQLVVSYQARTLRHIYWEARFDAAQERDRWRLLRSVLDDRYTDCDRLVERVVERTLALSARRRRGGAVQRPLRERHRRPPAARTGVRVPAGRPDRSRSARARRAAAATAARAAQPGADAARDRRRAAGAARGVARPTPSAPGGAGAGSPPPGAARRPSRGCGRPLRSLAARAAPRRAPRRRAGGRRSCRSRSRPRRRSRRWRRSGRGASLRACGAPRRSHRGSPPRTRSRAASPCAPRGLPECRGCARVRARASARSS